MITRQGMEQATDVDLPFRRTVEVGQVVSLVAQNAGGGSITCSIRVAGFEPIRQTSEGDFAVVTCAGQLR